MMGGALAAIFGLMLSAGAANAACTVGRLADLPVTMMGTRPMVPAKINGHEVMFMADSGAFYSMLSPSIAAELQLRLDPAPFGYRVGGVGGANLVDFTTVKTFTLANVDIPKVEFIVGAGAGGGESAGLLGQNVLGLGDVEYDLAGGVIRLFRPKGCDNLALAYWAGDKPWNVIDITYPDERSKKVTGVAYVNGKRIRVLFDTGASTSVMTMRAAERAGVVTATPGVTSGGYSHGIGPRAARSYIGPFASFKIGDEEIKNTRLRFSEFELTEADMLLGADFFLSHRVYVAHSQHKLYFTYNGGPVFNLSVQSAVAPTPGPDGPAVKPEGAADAAQADGKANSAAAEKSVPGEPTDADGYSRRAAAAAGRHDYEHAVADYSKAIEMAPNEAAHFYRRALVRLSLKQQGLATTDLDDALRLKPDDVDALVLRAQLRRVARDRTGAIADLDRAAGLAPKQADIRLRLAGIYQGMDLFDQAIAQYDLWIDSHRDEGEMVSALAGRCRVRALVNRDLDRALGDCNRAIQLGPITASMYDSRGLIQLRRGQYDDAIADYNRSLTTAPRSVWSLYGRGVSRLRKGDAAAGDADIAAALQIGPRFGATARRFGFAAPGQEKAVEAPRTEETEAPPAVIVPPSPLAPPRP